MFYEFFKFTFSYQLQFNNKHNILKLAILHQAHGCLDLQANGTDNEVYPP